MTKKIHVDRVTHITHTTLHHKQIKHTHTVHYTTHTTLHYTTPCTNYSTNTHTHKHYTTHTHTTLHYTHTLYPTHYTIHTFTVVTSLVVEGAIVAGQHTHLPTAGAQYGVVTRTFVTLV